MQHFSEQPLADFVRGVSAPQIGRDIRAHLTAGCAKCQTAIDSWSRVRRMATDEATYTPPENLVRLVKLGFAAEQAAKPQRATLANIIFDSFAQPLLAGVRSSGTLNVWQVICEAEGLTVDLRFGRRAQSEAVHLVGQVFDKQAARALPNNATVELSTEQNQLVASADVSQLGEFHIEFEAQDRLFLSVKASGRNTVRIPLTNPR
jgi:hypothetical protein